jgi:hypothetical protein
MGDFRPFYSCQRTNFYNLLGRYEPFRCVQGGADRNHLGVCSEYKLVKTWRTQDREI